MDQMLELMIIGLDFKDLKLIDLSWIYKLKTRLCRIKSNILCLLSYKYLITKGTEIANICYIYHQVTKNVNHLL